MMRATGCGFFSPVVWLLAVLPLVMAAAEGRPESEAAHAAISQSQVYPDQVSPAQVDRLVRQLGHSSFVERQKASRELKQIGIPAKAALEAALAHPDAEVRFRARRILVSVLELDFQVKLEAFLADPDGRSDTDLAGWPRYRALVGGDPAARRLFAEMQRAEHDLLAAAATAPLMAGELLEARCHQLQQQAQFPNPAGEQVALGSIASFLFVAGQEDVPITQQAGAFLNSFSHQQAIQQAMSEVERAGLLKKLLGAWVRRDFRNDPMASYQNLMLALRYGLKDGIEPALDMVQAPGTPPQMLQYAVLALGKLGSREHVADLEPLLQNETVCANQEVDDQEVQTQVRDVALAALVRLTGQQAREYGFLRAQDNAMILFNTPSFGFADPSQREAALKKWRDWSQAQPDGR
ncbi:MAG: hypothetical protein WD847_12055 [Pirellulales bacterium]